MTTLIVDEDVSFAGGADGEAVLRVTEDSDGSIYLRVIDREEAGIALTAEDAKLLGWHLVRLAEGKNA